ncbi:MAG: sugar ABC transporter substrate-binding protein [Planctomycetota bacterium]|nr:MAG: sugar ABC transporter substrate-binding protein [Planctomycetota bacterium]
MQRLLAALLLLAVAGCNAASSGDSGAEADGKDGYRIAVIPKGTTHVFWKSVHAGAQKAAKELTAAGTPVEIQWRGPLLENNREKQIDIVGDFVAQGIDGIVLAPLDSTALIPSVRDAQDAGIPTVIFDSGLADESIIVSYVATDNYHGGVLAAQELGKRLNGEGNVILLRYNVGSESTEQREEGFLDTLEKELPNINILSSDQYSGTTIASAQEKALQLCNRFGDRLDGFFAVCEADTIGVLAALDNEGLAGKITFIGFDPSPLLIDAMRDKKIQGLVLQDPVAMGYLGVKTMVEHLQGKEVPKRIPTGESMATPENMDDPEIDKLLNPEKAD